LLLDIISQGSMYLEASVVGPKNLLGSVRFPGNGQEQFYLLKISTNL